MQIRFQCSPKEVASMNTAEIRKNFLCESLMQDNQLNFIYTHYDRMIVGGAKPVHSTVPLTVNEELKAAYFLERRELGIINVNGTGKVNADGTEYTLEKLACLYLGKGTKDVSFQSVDPQNPASFFLLSSPAHCIYPNKLLSKEEASPVAIGSIDTANVRTIYKYIHLDGIQSCQLVMGLTVLAKGNVWNTMPAHTHTRRMEAYFYFDLAPEQRVMHFMGEPQETRHLVVADNEAVLSPPWSIHSGCGTANYGFIWGMAGENYNYTDMDPAPLTELR